MKTLVFLLTFITAIASAQQPDAAKPKAPARKPDPALAKIPDDPGLPRVLIIGDSISIGYTLPTRELLKGKANLHRIPRNGGSTKDALQYLDGYLADGKWDVIHFNWGLHDLKHFKDGKLDLSAPVVTPVDEYEKNLRELVKRMKASGAVLIWATTTPVPPGSDGRVAGDELKYNEAAARVMKDAGVKTNDLHALCVPNLAAWQRPANVHFTTEGSSALAAKVASDIQGALKK
jgi:lysophospholipase L1-like esterase